MRVMGRKKRNKNLTILLIAVGVIGLFYVSTLQALVGIVGYDEVVKYNIPESTSTQLVLNGHTYTVMATRLPILNIVSIGVTASHTSLDVISTLWPITSSSVTPIAVNIKKPAEIKLGAICRWKVQGISIECDVQILELQADPPDPAKCTSSLSRSCVPTGYSTSCGQQTNLCLSGVYQGWGKCAVTSACGITQKCTNPDGDYLETKCINGKWNNCLINGIWVPTEFSCEEEPVTCGNGIIDVGENCETCLEDILTVSGPNACDGECDFFCQLGNNIWYIVIGLGVVILLIGGFWPKKR
jgi:hypothetical protein